MNKSKPIRQGLGLKRSAGYRILLSIAALPALSFSIIGFIEFDEFVGPGKAPADLALKLLVGELFVALFFVSALSLVWALVAPEWVEKQLARHALSLQLGILLFVPGFFLFMYCLGL